MQLNHTIVSCRDQQRSAAFLTGILGLPAAARFGHFLVVEADNGVSLDFAETTGEIASQHYAFLVGEDEFDAAFGRIRGQELPYWADPGQTQRGAINHRDGGRGVYFEDPDGHLLELITRPYGGGSSAGRVGLSPGIGHADRPTACRHSPMRQERPSRRRTEDTSTCQRGGCRPSSAAGHYCRPWSLSSPARPGRDTARHHAFPRAEYNQ